MRRLFLLLVFTMTLAACGPKIKGTWRASHPNADSPALAIELVRNGKKYNGAMFLLDPNRPTDFTTGKSYPMTVQSADDHEIHYTVEFLPHEPDELVLKLSKPVDGVSFHAVMETVDGRGSPVEFDFERVIAK